MKIGFDNDKYLQLQSEQIKKRIDEFGGKLYLEFGGKLFDDFHAARVLPGFAPDSKLRMLLSLRDHAEIILVVNAADIAKNKMRADLGITYDQDALRLIDIFRDLAFTVDSVVITCYAGQKAADDFRRKLTDIGVNSYLHYKIEGYPSDVEHIVSPAGFGKNEFVKTTKPLAVITAPGPGSGKMATCLSQLYHEHQNGVRAGYAKFETFPIWNLPLRHPVNLAYEAATVDLDDVNMIDPYHLEAYGKTTVNYNRDVEIFPVLRAIMTRIQGTSPYQSPTDMGVNMVGFCIEDDEVVCEAARKEILRRYYQTAVAEKQKGSDGTLSAKMKILMEQAGVSSELNPAVAASLLRSEQTGNPAGAMVLSDGSVVTGKTSSLLGPSAALLLNALKRLAGIPKEEEIISVDALEPICKLKTEYLRQSNPRLHSDEVLIALSISSRTHANAALALAQLDKLRCCDAHFSVILSPVDERTYKRLGINVTCESVAGGKKGKVKL
ncbi:MAG: DUF1846 domain-containing protein [Clostridia bacterium]|nr:DUF1846 domain-containing protein [Clostridia bacterium]MBO7295804.1 DUF1846 domain-containing protein [Clostridia bacterium]